MCWWGAALDPESHDKTRLYLGESVMSIASQSFKMATLVDDLLGAQAEEVAILSNKVKAVSTVCPFLLPPSV